MLKPTFQLNQLPDDDSDIYLQTKFQTYLKRPPGLQALTYPEFFRWWRSATTAEQRIAAAKEEASNVQCKGDNDFHDFVTATQTLDEAKVQLSQVLAECEVEIGDGQDLLALCRAMQRLKVSQRVIDVVERHCNGMGIESLPSRMHGCPSETSHGVAQGIVEAIDESGLVGALATHHWLMGCKLTDELIAVLTRYKPGTVLSDCDGHYWYR